MTSRHSTSPLMTLERPRSFSMFKRSWMLGRRKSASTSRVLRFCRLWATARCMAAVVLPSRGVADVINSVRGRRARSESRIESRSVRTASSYADAWSSRLLMARSEPLVPFAPIGISRPRQCFTTGSEPRTSVFMPCWICSGSRTVLSRVSARTAAPTASKVENKSASSALSFRSGNTGL